MNRATPPRSQRTGSQHTAGALIGQARLLNIEADDGDIAELIDMLVPTP